jgi:hypothetical protein
MWHGKRCHMKELKVENEKKLGIKYQIYFFPLKPRGKHTHILIMKKQEPKQK